MSQERTMNGWVYRKVPGGWQKDRPEGPPADPTFPLEAPRMQGQIRQTDAQTGKTIADTALSRQQLGINEREQVLKERKFAAEEGKRQRSSGKEREAKKTQIMDLMSDILNINRIRRDAGDGAYPGLGEVGALGQVLSNIPGTAARDMKGQLDQLKSSIARSSLGRMRQESPTGGAVGALNEGERRMFEASRGPLDQDVGYNDFMRNLDVVEKNTWAQLRKISPKGADLLRQRMNGGQDDDDALVNKYLRRGR